MNKDKAIDLLVKHLKQSKIKLSQVLKFLDQAGIEYELEDVKKKFFGFNAQLKVGAKGEKLFEQNYPALLEKSKDQRWDFVMKSTGQKIEIKTDTYSAKTGNFFFEKISNDTKGFKQSPGGPWRAEQDKVDIFCYLYFDDKLCYEFPNVKRLVKRLNQLTTGLEPVSIKNRTYNTIGYKVPRDWVADLYIEWQFK